MSHVLLASFGGIMQEKLINHEGAEERKSFKIFFNQVK